MADRQPSLQAFLSSGFSTNTNTLNKGLYHRISCKDSLVVNRKFAALAMKKNQPKNPIKAVLAGIVLLLNIFLFNFRCL